MKNLQRKFSLLLLLMLGVLVVPLRAEDPLPVVHKRLVKTFRISKNSRLFIDNQYGNVNVKTWKSDRVRVVVTISTKAKTLQLAKKASEANRVHIKVGNEIYSVGSPSNLDTAVKKATQVTHVPVIIGAKVYNISCQTVVDTVSKKTPKTITIVNSSVNYQLYVPANLNLSIKNQFGNITTDDYAGTLNIDEKYGDITTGNLQAAGNINLEQGNLKLSGISTGNLSAKGFDAVTIGSVSGTTSCKFSSGNTLDISLKNNADSVTIYADNTRQVNFRGLNDLQASLKMHFKLTKFFNGSNLKFKQTSIRLTKILLKKPGAASDSVKFKIMPKDTAKTPQSSEDIIKLKKLAEFKELIKEPAEYYAGPTDGKGKVVLHIAFSVVNFY